MVIGGGGGSPLWPDSGPPIPALIAVNRPQSGRSSLILAYISGLLSQLLAFFSVLLASTTFRKMFPCVAQEWSIGLHLYFEFDTYQRMSWSNVSLKAGCFILGHSSLWANYLFSKPQLAGGTYSFWGTPQCKYVGLPPLTLYTKAWDGQATKSKRPKWSRGKILLAEVAKALQTKN